MLVTGSVFICENLCTSALSICLYARHPSIHGLFWGKGKPRLSERQDVELRAPCPSHLRPPCPLSLQQLQQSHLPRQHLQQQRNPYPVQQVNQFQGEARAYLCLFLPSGCKAEVNVWPVPCCAGSPPGNLKGTEELRVPTNQGAFLEASCCTGHAPVGGWVPERSWWAQGGVRVVAGVELRQRFFAKEVYQYFNNR